MLWRTGCRQLGVQAQHTPNSSATGHRYARKQPNGVKPHQQAASEPQAGAPRSSSEAATPKPAQSKAASLSSTPQAAASRRRPSSVLNNPLGIPNKAKQAAARAAAQRLPSAAQLRPRLVHAPFAGQRGPLVFAGEMRYALNKSQAGLWLSELLQLADASERPIVVGYDTETAVRWGRPQAGVQPTSLMQLCYHPASSRQPMCLLLPLSKLGTTQLMCDVLSHPNIIKVGIGITQDVHDLQRMHQAVASMQPQSLLDLNWLAYRCSLAKPNPAAEAMAQAKAALGIKTFDRPQAWGLAGLLQSVSEFTLQKPKKITKSNWARVPLSSSQIAYATADAYAGLIAYHSLQLLWLQQRQSRSDRSSSSLGSSRDPQCAVAEAAAVTAAPDMQPQQQHRMLFTFSLLHLTSAAFWGSYEPAVLSQQQWEQEVLQPGFQAGQLRLERSIASAAAKAEMLEAGDWQAGGHADTDMTYIAARAGWSEVA